METMPVIVISRDKNANPEYCWKAELRGEENINVFGAEPSKAIDAMTELLLSLGKISSRTQYKLKLKN